jgi:dTDP-4-dehydrorhamnose 3,5-epimerase
MIFIPTKLRDVWRIEIERRMDGRGFLARTMCEREFAAKGISHSFVQTNTAFTFFAGTVRGLHFQDSPHSISKLIRCTRGATFDVVVDLRPNSPTFLRWEGFELT